MRLGKKLEFTQADGFVSVKIPDAVVGSEGDIADCFVLEN